MKIKIAIITLASIFGSLFGSKPEPVLYPATFAIKEIGDDFMVVETATGFKYIISEPAEDCYVGDIISAIMEDIGEPNDISDDKVVDWRYSGWVKTRRGE